MNRSNDENYYFLLFNSIKYLNISLPLSFSCTMIEFKIFIIKKSIIW